MTTLEIERVPLALRILRPIANWLAKRSPRLAEGLAEYDASIVYANDVNALVYLSDRGLLSIDEFSALHDRCKLP